MPTFSNHDNIVITSVSQDYLFHITSQCCNVNPVRMACFCYLFCVVFYPPCPNLPLPSFPPLSIILLSLFWLVPLQPIPLEQEM